MLLFNQSFLHADAFRELGFSSLANLRPHIEIKGTTQIENPAVFIEINFAGWQFTLFKKIKYVNAYLRS